MAHALWKIQSGKFAKAHEGSGVICMGGFLWCVEGPEVITGNRYTPTSGPLFKVDTPKARGASFATRIAAVLNRGALTQVYAQIVEPVVVLVIDIAVWIV